MRDIGLDMPADLHCAAVLGSGNRSQPGQADKKEGTDGVHRQSPSTPCQELSSAEVGRIARRATRSSIHARTSW